MTQTSTTHPLEVSELIIKRGDYTVLDNVDLTLDRGVFASLVGPSGCGKTSLLRVLARLDRPTSGTVCHWGNVWGAVSTSGNGDVIYPRLNYVPQTLGLWPHLTLRDNLLFASSAMPEVMERFQELSNQLEISSILQRKPPRVSQGQRQRAALVRALLLKPQILLLDEMTAALDGRLATTVWTLLRTFATEGGTILASTHDQALAGQCDKRYRITGKTLTTELPDTQTAIGVELQ